MSERKADLPLIEAAAQLAHAAPQAWANFVAQMEAYASGWKRDLMTAPPDRLQTNQGQALQADRLAEMFKDAVATANRVAEKREYGKAK
jgi:lysozyme family protein